VIAKNLLKRKPFEHSSFTFFHHARHLFHHLFHQTVLVVDAMTGQDAVNVAKMFDEKVGIDGVILTKLDGDTRGGAALSIRAVTGKPILYVGMGEKLSDLEQFYPDRMASRILGMGDVLTLIEKAQADIDEEQAKRIEQKMRKNEFDFEIMQ
jgi:signal recognition particle subunit SRP54